MPRRRDYIPQITRAMIEDRVRQIFPDTDPAAVLAVLDQYGTAPGEPEHERVQMSILKLSEGTWEKLENYVKAAKWDYRDALAGAEYPGFLDVGFTGIGEMTPDQRRSLVEADEKQYKDWLHEGAASPDGESA